MTSTAPAATETFRSVFRRHPAAVSVITVGGPRPGGFTATSVASLSADPPLLTFNLATTASSWPAVASTDHVAVHLLGAGQSALATVFATSGIERLAAVPGWEAGPYGVPLLPGVAARLIARIENRFIVAGQAIVVAAVLHGEIPGPAVPGVPGDQLVPVDPLLYHDRAYTRLA